MNTLLVRPADRPHASTPAHPDGKARPARVAIVGGGITGLSAAWYLQQQATDRGLNLHCTVLEQSGRWGGKIYTEQVDGFGSHPFVIEAGPDSFLTQKPWALELARELGLGERVLDTNDHLRKVFVLNRGKPRPLPDGVLLIVPTRLVPFALSPLISLPGKLRMGLDLFIPPRRDSSDETVANFISRRLGTEALDKIAEPLMSGIYNAEAERQSLLATFPRFRALEQQHGSLIQGMLASRRERKPHAPNGSGKKPAMFVSLHAGTQELVEALVGQLNGDLRLEAGVEKLERLPDSSYHLTLPGGETLAADVVLVTTPATVAAGLLRGIAPQAAHELEAMRTVSTGTISLAYRQGEVAHPLDGFGLVIPRSEHRFINAVTWSSTKFDHRAPEGYVLLRVFFGGSRRPEMMHKDDGQLLAIVRGELAALLGIDAEPVLHRIYRWQSANPQYDIGHLKRVDAIEAALPPGLFVAGSPYRGIGVPDCVYQARQAAGQVVAELAQRVLA